MIVKFNQLLKAFLINLIILTAVAKPLFAQEITAIDFNGDLIGKVIPDGTVISFDNEVIGNVTADSFIVNEKGELIGGVIPQGVVIGNDNKLLGKVNNDGSVRLPSGKIVGKVLPNALVVNDTYDVLGAVLYPGLIYNDAGQTVGRLTGDGFYTNLEGQNIGFVSPLGYAYRTNGGNYAIDGRLISAKMVVSDTAQFIGSVAPGGKVTDFNSKIIGSIHANGFAYDDSNHVIGRIVNNGYAFDDFGHYLGLVAYNGEVVYQGDVVGRLRADGKVVDNANRAIGYKVDMAATATDLNGKYLGRIMPGGNIAQARENIGIVGPRGTVMDFDGKIIGQLVQPGPVFDYLGNFAGIALRNGTTVSVMGTPLGRIKGKTSYDNIGRVLGAVLDSMLVADANNNILGLTGISSDFNSNGMRYKVSPFGYVYSSDNILSGRTVVLDALYAEDGTIQSYAGINGNLQNVPEEAALKLTQYGYAVNQNNKIASSTITPYFAVTSEGENLGILAQNNLILDSKGKTSAKIVPEYKVVAGNSEVNSSVMPVIGTAGRSNLAIGINGSMLGYADINGIVQDYNSNIVGKVADGDVVIDTQNSFIGKIMPLTGIVNDECVFVGVVGPKGEIRNNRDVVLGRMITNGQAISELGSVMGYGVKPGAVIGFDGKILGSVNTLGRVISYARENLGCADWNGRLVDLEKGFLGAIVETSPIINFENMIIGRINMNGEAVNGKSRVVGMVRPDGTVMTGENEILGLAFKYRVAFGDDNSFLGRVLENGNVISDKNDILGSVSYDGTVMVGNKPAGYALYDFYVYDEKGQATGYISKNGTVVNFAGGNMGTIDKGFLIDKNYNIIARGNRDYFVRDDNYAVIGEILLNGDVINRSGEAIGTVSGSGEVRNSAGEILATARSLQYYNVRKPQTPRPADWAGTGPQIKVDAVPTPQPDNIGEFSLKTIGIALSPDGNYLGDILSNNDVIDKMGNLLGKKMPDGLIVDEDGGLIGIEEVKNTSAGQMFVPAGTFGSGGAYGTGNAPTNLGPGGGFGPGERYDPSRAAALAAAQAARRSEISVGKLTTNVDKKGFDGMQPYWEGVPRQISTWRVDMSEMILADKPIPAVLSRTIMYSNGADDVPVTAIVERNVYAEEGRNIVIPAGSRVMGSASGAGGGSNGGAVRVSITWTRLIRPDGSAFEFSAAKTGDAQGRGGALGYLDEQLLKKYMLPVATELSSDALSILMATSSSGTGEIESSRQQATNDARQSFLSNMDNIFDQILEDKTNIAAVTYVPAGTRLIIYPKEDLWLRTIDRSSEEEAQKAVEKPTVFLNDSNPVGKTNKNSQNNNQGSVSSTSGVVYEDEDVDVQATKPLLTEKPKKKKPTASSIPPVVTTGATPPPPSSSTGYVPPSSNANRGGDTSAQLF